MSPGVKMVGAPVGTVATEFSALFPGGKSAIFVTPAPGMPMLYTARGPVRLVSAKGWVKYTWLPTVRPHGAMPGVGENTVGGFGSAKAIPVAIVIAQQDTAIFLEFI